MKQEVFWILLSMIVILGAMVISVAILAMQDRRSEVLMTPRLAWRVELWNIRLGYRLEFCFEKNYILGRSTIAALAGDAHQVELDTTVSREHCMLYEMEGMIFVWNLSAVNPTILNGYRVNAQQRIVPGDRIELGNSVFLVTAVEQI